MAEESHIGQNLDYSKASFSFMKDEICIICHEKDENGYEHGEFWQSLENHIRHHQGCPKCGKIASALKRRVPYPKQIEKARKVHGDKYIYPDIDSVNNRTPIPIECPIHGIFWMRLNDHIDGRQGCPDCATECKKSMKYGVGVNDLLYAEHDRVYNYWNSMLRRCYSECFLSLNPAYRGCTVCPEWHTLSNFKKWFENPINAYQDGYALDKDILIKGNKVYSPDTCCFVPPYINTLLTNCKSKRGVYPIGVSKAGNGYSAQISYNKNKGYIGYFATPDEAFNAYKEAKESYIKEVAQEYYNEGKINKRVYDALMNWEIEITD